MKIVFATNNRNKVAEITEILPGGFEILNLKEIGCYEKLPESQKTIKGNAIQKAKFVFDNYGYNCFADDTGLEIDVLNGEPGVFSARYAGTSCNSEDNIHKVLQKMNQQENRNARFRTVIALIIDGESISFEGIVEGKIIDVGIGENGFGYDPIFQPLGKKETFAQMSKKEKGIISHRGIATRKLTKHLQNL